MIIAIVSAAFLASTASASQQTTSAPKHPMSVDDYATLRNARASAIAPDGEILYRVDFGGAEGPSRQEWRLIAADGGQSTLLHLPEHFTPIGFTRDGGLYGRYPVNKQDQLAVVPVSNARAAATPSHIVLLPLGIHSALLSPDGSRFAILASQGAPDPYAGAHTIVEAPHTSLYVVGADGTGGSWWCPALQDIADGPIAGGSIAWSPDGTSLAVISATPKIGSKDIRASIDVCDGRQARRVADVANSVTGIAWTADEIAFLSTTTSVWTPDHVWTVPARGGAPADRTPTLAGSAMSLVGDPHGSVWVLVARGVQTEVDAFRHGTLTPAFQWPDGSVVSTPVFSELAAGSRQVALTIADPTHATNIAVPKGDELQRLTTEGDDQIGRIDLGPVRVVKWTSNEGITLEGIATFPAGYAAGRTYPFLVLPHGGPESSDTLRFDAFSRIIAGLGYVVLQPEYRGSTGYGSDFMQAIYQHFGDRAYRDVNSATDFAIVQGWADPNRLAMFGWSAGGFMTSWTVTQTNRYRAAIEGAGITDWGSFMWTSDVQQWDYDARWPDKEPQPFQRFSAVMLADRVTTPLLILHGEADQRVPAYQGREYFEALAAHGKTTRLVTYPGSGHFPTLWEQRRDVFREISAWLAKYNRPPGS